MGERCREEENAVDHVLRRKGASRVKDGEECGERQGELLEVRLAVRHHRRRGASVHYHHSRCQSASPYVESVRCSKPDSHEKYLAESRRDATRVPAQFQLLPLVTNAHASSAPVCRDCLHRGPVHCVSHRNSHPSHANPASTSLTAPSNSAYCTADAHQASEDDDGLHRQLHHDVDADQREQGDDIVRSQRCSSRSRSASDAAKDGEGPAPERVRRVGRE